MDRFSICSNDNSHYTTKITLTPRIRQHPALKLALRSRLAILPETKTELYWRIFRNLASFFQRSTTIPIYTCDNNTTKGQLDKYW